MIRTLTTHPITVALVLVFAAAIILNPFYAIIFAMLFALGAGMVESLPKFGFFIILALVPMDALSAIGARPDQVTAAASLSLVKLIFPPALALMIWNLCLSKGRLVRNRQMILAALFLSSVCVSYLLNPSNYMSVALLRRYVSLALLFFLAANVIKTRRDLALVMIIMVVSCFTSSAAALLANTTGITIPGIPEQAVWQGHARMVGLQNYAEGPAFAVMLLVPAFIIFRFSWIVRSTALRILLLLLTAFFFLSVVSTLARGGVLALVLVGLYAVIRFRRELRLRFVIPAAILLAVASFYLIPPQFYSRVSAMTVAKTDDTFMRRFGSNMIAMKVFLRSPVIGCGPGGFIEKYLDTEFRYIRYNPDGAPEIGHGLYHTIACEMGFIGLVLLLLLMLKTVEDLNFVARSVPVGNDPFLKHAAEALLLSFLTLLVTSLFENNQLHKYLWTVFAVAPVLRSIAVDRMNETQNPSLSPHSPS